MTLETQTGGSTERIRRAALITAYGSLANYDAKVALAQNPEEQTVRAAYHAWKVAPIGGTNEPGAMEEATTDAIGGAPYWMCPVTLARLPLALLGAPENTAEWDQIKARNDLRAKRKDEAYNAVYRDYTLSGWPRTAGVAVRMTTPEEHHEILRRLSAGTLTRAGADVSTVDYPLADLMANPPVAPDYLIDGLLRRGGAMMVYGPSGVGKSWIVQTLMIMLARGRQCGIVSDETGRYVLRAGDHSGARVALIDGENVIGDIVSRAGVLCGALKLHPTGALQGDTRMAAGPLRAALTSAEGVEPADVEAWVNTLACADSPAAGTTANSVPEGFDTVDLSQVRIAPKTLQDHRAQFVDLVDPECKSLLVSYCQRNAIDVLIFDNLSTLTPTLEEENSASAWVPFNDLVVALKAAGIATISVHHTGKAGTSYRGSSALETTMETIIALRPLQGPQRHRGAGFTVDGVKDRANGRCEIIGKTLTFDGQAWCVQVDEFEVAQRVVDLVKTKRYATQQEVADEIGVSQATVSRIFKVADELGLGRVEELKADLRAGGRLRRDLQSPFIADTETEAVDVPALDI